MDLRRATFLPYRLATLFPGYHDNPEVFDASSVVFRAGRVFARDAYPDGWTVGGDRARILVHGARAGRLELKVATWMRAGQSQHVSVRLMSGRVLEGALPPDSTVTLLVDLGEDDVFRYPRFEDPSLAYVDVRAEPWIPAWDRQSPPSTDARRLGLRFLGARSNGQELLARP